MTQKATTRRKPDEGCHEHRSGNAYSDCSWDTKGLGYVRHELQLGNDLAETDDRKDQQPLHYGHHFYTETTSQLHHSCSHADPAISRGPRTSLADSDVDSTPTGPLIMTLRVFDSCRSHTLITWASHVSKSQFRVSLCPYASMNSALDLPALYPTRALSSHNE